MDQVRVILAWIKQHHFWLLCVVLLGVSIGSWYVASGALSSEFSKNQKQIAGEFTKLSSLQNRPFQPNEEVNRNQAAEIDKLAGDVPLSHTFRGVLPFLVSDLVRVALLVAFPALTLVLLDLF